VTGDAARARREAHDILAERRFHASHPPRPFRRPLELLSDGLSAVGRAIWRVLEPIVNVIPGDLTTVEFLGAAAVIILAAVLASRTVRRRARELTEESSATAPQSLDPRTLEREADEAERQGDFERALRLRFRAGLLRLDRAGAIDYRDSLTSGAVARRLRSSEFDGVAATFDEVVYGRRGAAADDVRRSRDGWARVLAGAAAS
jgi:Domain of unknown function (DUF4129)